jgi:hypothetical protein
LGPFVTQLLDFPYAAATGSVTAAKSYSRLDGFTYYIYFICSLIKASVILACILRSAKSINKYLSEKEVDVVDIKYQVAINVSGEEQIYCFSAMIIYK